MQTAISVNTPALGDTLAAIPTIRKVSKAYETPITVFTQFPELFQNHPCVKEAFPLNAPKEGYNVLNTFSHLAGKTHNLNGNKVQFKYTHTDNRQYHALSLGFTLLPEEMETDLYVEETWDINFKDYVVIHPTHTWPSRTWGQDKWQDLVYKLNKLNIPVVAIGKNSIEQGNVATYDKKVMEIDIPYGINLMNHPDDNLLKVRNLFSKSKCVITMDSGMLHLAGTTDAHIIQLGSSINPKLRAPYRKGTQDYKYTYVKGGCDLQCASSLKYNLKVHGHLQETPPVATCLEKKPTFECHPKVEDVIKAVKKLPTMKQKLLYITPHLSTGGAPQYLLKKIELLKNEYDISLVEYTDLGGRSFVVQKDKIFNIIPPEKRITLGEDKTQLLDFLDKVQPDIVHLEEIPEMFMDNGVAEILYDKNRNYTIFETSHDSSQDPNNKRFFPDKFMFVSNWQIDQYKDVDVPAVLVEYPIEYKETKNRKEACKRLGLNPNKKHIINVGLFTPRKNQAEFFEYARAFPEYEFHCIGNQAGNFKHYWEPLMKNKPDNLTWWGERNDVDNFYEAADLFLFTSKGNSRDKETMPLSIREALSWKLPILIYNLEVYQNYFNNYPVEYLIDNKEQNIKNIKNIMEGFEIVSSPITAEDFDISFEGENKINFSYKKAEQFNCKVVVKEKYSNAPMYWFNTSFANYGRVWCVPNQGFSIKDSWVTELTLEFYTLSDKFLFSKDLFIKENGIKPSVKLELANNFDCLFHNYAEMFVDKNYDFLFKDKLSTVLDIGANAGTFCKLFLEKGASKVYAFEPNQDALTNLNYLASKEPNLKVIEKAVHVNEEDLKFYIDTKNTTIGSSDPNHLHLNQNIKEIIVPTITLKNFVEQENLSKIDLVKIDIEGAEYDIIENLEDEIYNVTDRFLIEWHDNTDERIQKLIDKLTSKGYSITKIFQQNSKDEVFNNKDYKQSIIGTFLAEKVPPKVTVIIPTYNHENYIEQCIDSVLSQKTDFNFNILISDDCSTDGTWEKLQQYKDIPNVTLHQPSKNIGPYFKRFKELYQLTNSEYITLLDGDDFYVKPNKLQIQVDFLDSNPEYVIHAVNYWYTNDKGEFITPEGLPTNVCFKSLKDRIHSYKECLGGNYVGFGPMWRNIFDYNLIDLYPTNDNKDFRWGEFMLYLQKGKCYNENTRAGLGAYRLLNEGSQFTSQTESEKQSFSKKTKQWNDQYITNDIIIIDAFIHDSMCLKKLKQSVNNLKPLGLPLMLVTNSKPKDSILDLFDYVIYDHNNRLFEEYYNDVETINLWHHSPNYKWEARTRSTQKHGLSVLANLYTSTNFAKSLGFTHFYRIEYDAIIENPANLIKEAIKTKSQNKKGFAYINEGRFIGFQAWYFDLDLFTSIFPQINNEYQYKEALKSFSNKDFLVAEEFVYNLFSSTKAIDQIICKPPQDQHTDFGENSKWNTIVTPAESSLIQEGYVALPFKIKGKNEVALITWNLSKEGSTNNIFTITRNKTTSKITHNIKGKGCYEITKIPVTDEDLIVETRSDTYTINTSNLDTIPHNYEDLSN